MVCTVLCVALGFHSPFPLLWSRQPSTPYGQVILLSHFFLVHEAALTDSSYRTQSVQLLTQLTPPDMALSGLSRPFCFLNLLLVTV